MEIQRESTPTPEDDDMEIITIYINREFMKQVQDSPGSANVRLSDSVDEKVGVTKSTISVMSEELNVASSLLTDSVLDEDEVTNVPQIKDEKVGDAESTISIMSKELNVASCQLTDSVLDKIKVTNVPQNKDEKVGGAESTISIMSKELNVASCQRTNSVLDEIKDTFGQKEKSEKSTMTDPIPEIDPTCRKILVQPVKKLPAEAPAKEAICTAEKMKKKKKKDQILGFFRRSWQTTKRIFNKRSNMEIVTKQVQDSLGSTYVHLPNSVEEKVGVTKSTISVMSEELNVASSPLTDSVLDEDEVTNVPQNKDEKVGGAESTISIMSEELNVASCQLTDSVLDKIEVTNVPQNKDQKVRGPESTISIMSKELNVASCQQTNSVLDEIKDTFGQKEKSEKSTMTDPIPEIDPTCRKILVQPVKKLPAEAPAKEAICTAEKMKKKKKKKKDQILGFFRRSWQTMKRICNKRSNKVSPL
ncbi:uncharacterized protein LOC134320294 [Trichomycterus rosablanca]|uniref:uncharacterized protein LOC134306492 n=1 Tax=Trichomycterus rosablanca TaxID=2290929 RepID=UPI002F35F0E4